MAQNEQKDVMTLVTCCASSRVGTRIRAVVCLLVLALYTFYQMAKNTMRSQTYSFAAEDGLEDREEIRGGFARAGLCSS